MSNQPHDRLTALNLPEDFILPNYSNGTIANVPATVAALLDVPFTGLPPLRPSLWRPLAGGVRCVVLFIVDALGWNLFSREAERLPGVRETAVTGQIASVFPSTTTAALSSMWTGVGPAQHSMVGLRLLFPEYGTIGQMLKFSPAFATFPNALVDAGLEPEQFLQAPGMAEQLEAAGVETHAFKGREIVDSALSKMHGRGLTADHGAVTLSDMLVQVRRLLTEKAGRSPYVNAYWPSIDTLSHVRGWDSDAVVAELHAIFTQVTTEFLVKVGPTAVCCCCRTKWKKPIS